MATSPAPARIERRATRALQSHNVPREAGCACAGLLVTQGITFAHTGGLARCTGPQRFKVAREAYYCGAGLIEYIPALHVPALDVQCTARPAWARGAALSLLLSQRREQK